jgi:hypothetical protein
LELSAVTTLVKRFLEAFLLRSGGLTSDAEFPGLTSGSLIALGDLPTVNNSGCQGRGFFEDAQEVRVTFAM